MTDPLSEPDIMPDPVREDQPQPDLPELQQREVFELPSVPVRIDGPAQVNTLPSRRFSVSQEPVGASTANATRVLTNDPTRRRAIILFRSGTSTDFFLVQSASTGQGVAWPANVPLVMDHCDEVYAKGGAAEAISLSVLIESWAD